MNKAHPLLKKTLKVSLWLLAGFVFIIILIAGLIQIPAIQNKIVNYASSFVSKKTNTEVSIKNIHISFPKSIVIKEVFLDDYRKDTLLYAGKLEINISLLNLLSKKINIKDFALENVNLNINRALQDSLFNFNFLLTAFSDSTKQKKSELQTNSPWEISIGDVNLKNIKIHFNDNYGRIFVESQIGNLDLEMDKIDLKKSVYDIDKIDIEDFIARVSINKPTVGNDKKSDGLLPKISANKLQIRNSKLAFIDSVNELSVNTSINIFESDEVLVDLQREIITSDKIYLAKSEAHYINRKKNLSADTIPLVPNNGSDFRISVKNIGLDDNLFTYKSGNKPEIKKEFDINNLSFDHLFLQANDLIYSKDSSEVSIKKFSAIDQNDFVIKEFNADFFMGKHSITVKSLKLKSANSSIIANLNFTFPSLKIQQKTIPFIKTDVNIVNASIQNSDILYFSPSLNKQPFFKDKSNITIISGVINGPVNKLFGKNINIKTGDSTFLKTDFIISGLPGIDTTHFNFPNLTINTIRKDIEMMVGSVIPENIGIPENLGLQAEFNGQIKSFESNINLESSYGDVKLTASINKNQSFHGNVSTTGFNLGGLLKDSLLFGPVAFTLDADGKGLNIDTIESNIKAEVSRIYLNKYTYHNLKINGKIDSKSFDGNISLNDENAVFVFTGIANLNKDEEEFAFKLNVKGADLQKLNLTNDDLRLSLLAEFDLKGRTVSKLNGKAGITNVIFAKGEEKYVLDSLLFASINEPNKSELSFTSALIGIKYAGTVSPSDISAKLNKFLNNYFPFSDSIEITEHVEPVDFNFEIQLHNHPVISKVLFNQLKEFEPGIIKGSFNSVESDLELSANLYKLVYGNFEIRDFAMNINSNPNVLNYKLSCSLLSNLQIQIDNFLIDGKLEEKVIFTNISSIDDNKDAKFIINSQFTKNKSNYRLKLSPDDLFIMNNKWHIAADNYIEFGKEGILFHNFLLNNDSSKIGIASVNNRFNDDLKIEINNFKLNEISQIIDKNENLIQGNVNGNVLLKRVNDAYGLIADAKISNLIVRDIPVGNLSVIANNATGEKFDFEINLSGMNNDMTVTGHYIPDTSRNSINIKSTIRSLSMQTVEAFSMGHIKESSGTLSGNFSVQGNSASPEITGELIFKDAFINPLILNNTIGLKNEKIQLKTDGLYFNSFTLTDANNQTATIDGTIKMKQFKDFNFDMRINTNDFLLFNSTIKDNKEFYGKLVIDSKIDIEGPMNLPVVNGRLNVENGSNFTFILPESRISADRGEDIVEFEDSLKLNPILNKTPDKIVKKSRFTGFDVSGIIEIDKQATLRLLMDPLSTDSLVLRGEASLSFAIDRSGKMSLTGAYYVDEGNYLVSLEFLKRKFDIIPGSSIIWNGEPLNAEISIDTKYIVRAAPYDLMAAQMSGLEDTEQGSYKQQFTFWVLLKLRGEILHPEITFEIQLPPENRGILGGSVNQKLIMLKEDESALSKQVFALLVLGRFIQENPLQTATGGASTVVRSTVGNFLSAQLNKFSSQAIQGMELNFDIQSYDEYETGEAKGRTQVEIGVKKQLLDERLSVQVGGSVDVEGEKARQNKASEITGDVSVEYKLTEDGRLRMKAFRHNQYEGAIEGQLIETGIGILYVRDFTKWKEFFKPLQKEDVIRNKKQ